MQMLIIGHSKIGKSTFAKNLATALNIEYID
jgi:shikimate kinase